METVAHKDRNEPYITTSGNKFLGIKKKREEAGESGKPIIDLSIGQPQGPALRPAREEEARLILSEDQAIHEYQDNGCLPCPDFGRRFVHAHIPGVTLGDEVEFLPIPGIKSTIGQIVRTGVLGKSSHRYTIQANTRPGYPTPEAACQQINRMGGDVVITPLNTLPENGFLSKDVHRSTDMVMLNLPHNPTGQIAPREWLRELCAFCEAHNIRIFNDAAYTILDHSGEHTTLTEVAQEFPMLRWAEAFSASKAGNFTGWRIGAVAGSYDFIEDIRTVKGDEDSGFNAALALGILHAFENDMDSIQGIREIYEERLYLLIEAGRSAGMPLSVEPKAGFFTLWQIPKQAFGQQIKSAEHFNHLMIEKTGVVGVHFEPSYIRYAVVGDIESQCTSISEAFKKAEVSY